MPVHITEKEMRRLPFLALKIIARETAKDIDSGEVEKRDLLEKLFQAMKEAA